MVMTEQQNMMRRLQVQSFVLDDIRLYLDTHPDDKKALEWYHKYRKLKEQTEKEYVDRFGPLNSFQVDSDTRWTWVDTPWPWEGTV